jgi:hypothetical protein
MAAAADLDTLASRLVRRARRGSFADRVGQGLKVVGLRGLIGLAEWEPDDVPATRGGHPVSVPGTQVIAMRLDKGRQRAKDRR